MPVCFLFIIWHVHEFTWSKREWAENVNYWSIILASIGYDWQLHFGLKGALKLALLQTLDWVCPVTNADSFLLSKRLYQIETVCCCICLQLIYWGLVQTCGSFFELNFLLRGCGREWTGQLPKSRRVVFHNCWTEPSIIWPETDVMFCCGLFTRLGFTILPSRCGFLEKQWFLWINTWSYGIKACCHVDLLPYIMKLYPIMYSFVVCVLHCVALCCTVHCGVTTEDVCLSLKIPNIWET